VKTGHGQASFSVSVGTEPKVLATSLPDRTVARKAPPVIAWVRLNRDALERFWDGGEFWSEEQIESFKAGLKPVSDIT